MRKEVRTLLMLYRIAQFRWAGHRVRQTTRLFICGSRRQFSTVSATEFADNNDKESTSNSVYVEPLPRPSEEFYESLSSEQKEHVEIVLREYEVLRYVDRMIPQTLNDQEWKRLLECHDKRSRMSELNYIARRQFIVTNDLKRRKERAEKRKVHFEKMDELIEQAVREGRLIYGQSYNSIIKKYFKPDFYRVHLARQLLNVMNNDGPKICIDMRWIDNLTAKSHSLTGKQLLLAIAASEIHRSAYPLTFINCPPKEHPSWQMLMEKYFNNLYQRGDKRQLLLPHFTGRDYLELYPKESLLYLTKDSPHLLEEVTHDRVYVVGGLVDVGVQHRVGTKTTLAQAKMDGVQHARFPISETLRTHGKHDLLIPSVVSILMDVYYHGDWEAALRYRLPKRYFLDPQDPARLPSRAKRLRDMEQNELKMAALRDAAGGE